METNTSHPNSFIGQVTSNLLIYTNKTFPSSFKYLLKHLVFQDDIVFSWPSSALIQNF